LSSSDEKAILVVEITLKVLARIWDTRRRRETEEANILREMIFREGEGETRSQQ